ncbi:MAG TPA: histone deacetylase family protein [Gammaproteobacteria bacterium]
MRRTAYLTHPACHRHAMFAGHPECPERLGAIEDRLLASGLLDLLAYHEAPRATREQLLRVHSAAHLAHLEQLAPEEGLAEVDPDTWMNPATLEAAYRAAGANVRAVDLVLGGQAHNAWCNVRPPGHHAEPGQAMGFCFFNNVAVAAAHALAAHGLERVAIADFDVHHGNGTEVIFANSGQVLVCSSYRHPFYPYSTPLGRDHLVHAPLPAGSDGIAFRAAVEEHWLPALDAFAPELILVSAGFDAHREDEMGGLRLLEADYAWVTRELVTLAERHARGRIVSTLEGGYALSALGRSVAAHVRVLLGL